LPWRWPELAELLQARIVEEARCRPAPDWRRDIDLDACVVETFDDVLMVDD